MFILLRLRDGELGDLKSLTNEPNKLTKSNTFILLFKIIFHWIQSAELKADRSSEKDKIKLVRCNYPNCHKVKKINTWRTSTHKITYISQSQSPKLLHGSLQIQSEK